MSRRRISKFRVDGSHSDVYLNEDGSCSMVLHEKIPVYAVANTVIGDDITPVTVSIGIKVMEIAKRIPMLFEGDTKDRKLQCLDGVLDPKEDVLKIYIQRKIGESGYPTRVKCGERLGTVSSIVEVEDRYEKENIEWTLDRMKSEVEIGEQTSIDQKNKIYDMLMRSQLAFGINDLEIGKANVVPHRIELTDYTPIWQRPRRFADPINKEVERQCEELVDLGIIEHSNSQFSSPVVPVRKKDGSLRLCIDYRKINSVTKTEKFPMPNLTDSIYSAHNIRYFSKLDLIKGYYQVPLEENSRQYTAFSTPHNHFHFKRLSFGLKNSGIAFQKNMQEILSEFCFKNVIVYIDDILIMTETFEEHLTLVEKFCIPFRLMASKLK